MNVEWIRYKYIHNSIERIHPFNGYWYNIFGRKKIGNFYSTNCYIWRIKYLSSNINNNNNDNNNNNCMIGIIQSSETL